MASERIGPEFYPILDEVNRSVVGTQVLQVLERHLIGARTAIRTADSAHFDQLGKSGKFITVVSNLETGEPLWFGRDRKKETLDGFFCSQLHPLQRVRVRVACVDMWEPYKFSAIVYDKFHVLQHARRSTKFGEPSSSIKADPGES
jgi:transposase